MNKVVHENKTYFGRDNTIVLADGYAYVMVAVYDGYEDMAGIHDLVVHKDKRGEGLGRTLLAEAEEEGRRMGATIARVIAEHGSWLEEWYGRHGYERVSVQGYGAIMDKDITRREAAEPQ